MNNLIYEYQRSASAQHTLIYFVLQYIYLISIINIWREIFGKFPLTRLFGSLEYTRLENACQSTYVSALSSMLNLGRVTSC